MTDKEIAINDQKLKDELVQLDDRVAGGLEAQVR